ncbi:hypothetical protein A8E81_10830 [Burkholderia cenocepacia]|nr:hypothetical protein A8E75_30735 [Burkholderia cenocepacia]ONV25310.1 hypothetical protein A8E74_09815 [Burkholderia cenocepacia]ONV30566.1 hypothetical protein A8E78_17310 [Burkholderia cenocepacia]ONV33473.1 hypothetical protein A8E77_15980 [Burkholderia cenocepacia]ONV55324.1 hypothetical protein A8E81_10830 [Burkholderia cenocepacia]
MLFKDTSCLTFGLVLVHVVDELLDHVSLELVFCEVQLFMFAKKTSHKSIVSILGFLIWLTVFNGTVLSNVLSLVFANETTHQLFVCSCGVAKAILLKIKFVYD